MLKTSGVRALLGDCRFDALLRLLAKPCVARISPGLPGPVDDDCCPGVPPDSIVEAEPRPDGDGLVMK
jgi:hypothetical protein